MTTPQIPLASMGQPVHHDANRGATDTIQNAYEAFELAIRPSDARMFKSTTLAGVREAAKIIERDQAQRRTLRNLRRVEPFFQALGRLGGALETLCQGTPYLCFLWAPVKLLLQIADDYTEGFGALVDAYGKIARHLPRLGRYKSTFEQHPDFQEALADVYVDLLEFHHQAYKLLRRPGWKLLFDASWRGFQSRFNAILQKIERSKQTLDSDASSFDMLEAKAFRTALYDDLERRERERQDRQLRETMIWLDLKGSDREQANLFDRRASARHPETCRWILNDSAITSWLDIDDKRAFVWLHGKPGSGKTTLATYLAEHCNVAPDSNVVYCLCSYGFGKGDSSACSILLRSIAAQLLRNRHELLPHIYDNFVKQDTVPSLKRLRDLFEALMHSVGTLFLIVDGLDECEDVDQKQILTELGGLAQQRDSVRSSASLKILLCSRETKVIYRKLNKAAKVSLTKRHDFVKRDIAIFVTHELQDLAERYPTATIDWLKNELLSKAEGMFLWAQLVLTTLHDQESEEDVRRAMHSLPPGLPGVYKYILDRICQCEDPRQATRARYVLSWLAFTYRPLKSWELCDGLVFCDAGASLTQASKLGQGILDICKPLIEEREDTTYALVHHSVREFLLHERSTANGPYLKPSTAHSQIALMCLSYLSSSKVFLTSQPPAEVYTQVILGFHDLYPYAYDYWFRHVTECITTTSERTGLLDDQVQHMVKLILTDGFHRSPVTDESYPMTLDQRTTTSTSMAPSVWREYVRYRQIAPWLDRRHDPSARNEDTALQDPTRHSEAFQTYRAIFEAIFEGKLPYTATDLKLDDGAMRVFRARHAGSAYPCRFRGCSWSATGLHTAEARSAHENLHLHGFTCPENGCGLRMGSKRALRNHTLKYHSKATDLAIPPFAPKGRKAQRDVDGGIVSPLLPSEVEGREEDIAVVQQQSKNRANLSHSPEPTFYCSHCQKIFHRLDLLQRHEEYHDIKDQLKTESTYGNQNSHKSQNNQVSSLQEVPPSIPLVSGYSPNPGSPGEPNSSFGTMTPTNMNSPGYRRPLLSSDEYGYAASHLDDDLTDWPFQDPFIDLYNRPNYYSDGYNPDRKLLRYQSTPGTPQ